MEDFELKLKAIRAVVWTVVHVGTSNVVSFVVFSVLARTLSPSDLGVFALAILIVDIARIVSSAGLSDAITRDNHHDEVLADTAFWANLALGCIVGIAIWMAAYPYGSLVGQPQTTAVL